MNDHPEELLALYPDLLDEADRERVEGHLQHCEACRERVARLTTVARASRALPELKPSRELDRRARQRMVAEARVHTRRPRPWPLLAWKLLLAHAPGVFCAPRKSRHRTLRCSSLTARRGAVRNPPVSAAQSLRSTYHGPALNMALNTNEGVRLRA